jgi:hypothetical protein
MPFYIRDLHVGIWVSMGVWGGGGVGWSWNWSPMGTEGWLHYFHHLCFTDQEMETPIGKTVSDRAGT